MAGISGDGEDDYSRIIVISDGTEDSRMGVTYEELIALLDDDDHRLPIYTIGFKYDPAASDMDKLFSLSRKTNTPYFWVEDYKDAALIADGITSDADNVNYFKFNFPPQLRTGDIRSISPGVKTDSSGYEIVHTMALPTASLSELEAMQAEKARLQEYRDRQDEQIGELQSEVASIQAGYPSADSHDAYKGPEAEPETDPGTEPNADPEVKPGTEPGAGSEADPATEMNETGTAIGVLLLSLIGLVIYGDRTRRNNKGFQTLEPVVKEENIEPVPEPDAALTKRIVLIDTAQPDMQYAIDLEKSILRIRYE